MEQIRARNHELNKVPKEHLVRKHILLKRSIVAGYSKWKKAGCVPHDSLAHRWAASHSCTSQSTPSTMLTTRSALFFAWFFYLKSSMEGEKCKPRLSCTNVASFKPHPERFFSYEIIQVFFQLSLPSSSTLGCSALQFKLLHWTNKTARLREWCQAQCSRSQREITRAVNRINFLLFPHFFAVISGLQT